MLPTVQCTNENLMNHNKETVKWFTYIVYLQQYSSCWYFYFTSDYYSITRNLCLLIPFSPHLHIYNWHLHQAVDIISTHQRKSSRLCERNPQISVSKCNKHHHTLCTLTCFNIYFIFVIKFPTPINKNQSYLQKLFFM